MSSFLVLWAAAVIGIGAVLTSYHQPFLTPAGKVLALASPAAPNRWQAVHLLSGSCGCSQRVMRHLLQRQPLQGAAEQIILVDGPEPYLPDTDLLLKQLGQAGFPIRHLAAASIPADYGLRGVPLLIIASPQHKVAYMGGYGPQGDQDSRLFHQVSAGQEAGSLPVLGCAIGSHIRQQADPLGLKYKQ